MPNKNGSVLILLVFSIALLLTALLLQNGDIALLAIPLLIYFVTGYWLRPQNIKLSASHTLNKTGTLADHPVEGTINVVNGETNLDQVVIRIKPLPGVQYDSNPPSQTIALSAGEQISLDYQFRARRGVYTWHHVSLTYSDPFGLFPGTADVPAPTALLVRPQIERLRHLALRPRNTLHTSGTIPARIAGSGSDFWGVREYHPGDPLHHLNWHLAARRPGQLFTKEFEQEEIIDIGLILDARVSNNGAESLLEHSVRACASLAEVFLREGNRVSLLVFGQQMGHCFPGYGKEQFNNILRILSGVTPSENISLSNLEFLRKRLFPGRSQILMVSPLSGDDLRTYRRLRAYRYPILLLSPDPVSFYLEQVEAGDQMQLAAQAARLERQTQLQTLLQLGIQVIDWPVHQALNGVLHGALQANNGAAFFPGGMR